MEVQPGDVPANVARAERLVRVAADKGARLCVLPELCLGGAELSAYSWASAREQTAAFDRFAHLASELDVTIVCGVLRADGAVRRNSQVCLTPGGVAGVYDKRALVLHEHAGARAGERPAIFSTPLGAIGAGICKDLLYPDLFAPYVGRVDLVCVSSAWPVFEGGLLAIGRLGRQLTDWIDELPGRVAALVGAPVVYCNAWGGPHDILGMGPATRVRMAGHSRIVTPGGETLGRAEDGEALVVADVALCREPPRTETASWRGDGLAARVVALETFLCRGVDRAQRWLDAGSPWRSAR